MLINKQKIFTIGKEHGFEETKIMYGSGENTQLKWENGKIETAKKILVEGIKLSGIIKGNESTIHLTGFDEEKIISLFRILVDLNKHKTKEADARYISKGEYKYALPNKKLFEPLKINQAKDILEKLGTRINKEVPHVLAANTQVYYSVGQSISSLTNSKGLNLSKESGSTFSIAALIFVRENENSERIFFQKAYSNIREYSEQEVVDEMKKEVAQKLTKGDFEAKDYEIVFAPDVCGELINNLFRHFNGRSVIDNRSVWIDKLNTQVASEKLTLIDKPMVPEIGLYKTYDDDGLPTQEMAIIDKGVLKTFITDLATAKVLKTKSTGHASGSTPALHYPYVQPGTKNNEEILASVKDGMYITKLAGLHSGLNADSGDFSLEVSGNLIKNGKLLLAIKTGVISGNAFRDVLNAISEVGSDLDFTKGQSTPTIKLTKKLPITK